MPTTKEIPAAAAATTPTRNEDELVTEIKRLNGSILTMRSMVNELIASHNELKEKVTSLQTTQTSRAVAKAQASTDVVMAMQHRESVEKVPKKTPVRRYVENAKTCHADEFKRFFAEEVICPEEFESTDDEIDDIIKRRIDTGEWPITHKAYHVFSTTDDLLKIRFHHSEKYAHVPVRISTVGSKDGRSRCKLCMSYSKESKGVGRNTSWMCSTCEIPLCVKCVKGEDNDVGKSHFGRWHCARDLVSENMLCFDDVDRSRKRNRESLVAEALEGEADYGEEVSGGEV